MKLSILLTSVLAGTLACATLAFAQQDSQYERRGGISADASAGAYAGAYSNTVVQNNRYPPADVTVRSAPTIAAPGIITAYQCALARSGGVSIIGGGITYGESKVEERCARVAEAAALNTLLGKDAAILHLASGSEGMCKTIRGTLPEYKDVLCTDAEKRRAAIAARRAARAEVIATMPTHLDDYLFSACYRDETGLLNIRYKKDVNRREANDQCREYIKA